MGTKVSFYLRTKAEIEALTNSVDGAVYFASDSPHIYRGTGGVPHKSTFSGVYNDLSGKPITITTDQANAIVANTAKVGITTEQANDILTNNNKVGITTEQANDILTNNGKVGITTEQANDILTNNNKVGITTEQANDILTNNGKVGITTEQANAIVANTAKVGYEDSLVSALYQPDGTNPFVYTDNNGNLHIDGNIYQNGSIYETHAEQLYTKKNIIITRDGATVGLSVNEYTGIQAKLYDGINDGQLVFDNTGVARVGDVGSLQPLATREENPINGYFAQWDNTNNRFNTVQIGFSDLISHPTTLSGYGITDTDLTDLSLYSTSNLSEGSNLYFTDSRVTNNVSVLANTAKVSSQWITSGSNIYYNSGNVTIGSTTSVERLQVYNLVNTNFHAEPTIGLSSDRGDYYSAIGTYRGGGSTQIGLSFFTTNAGALTNRMTIAPDGKVGIGTTVPETILHTRKDVANGKGATLTLENNEYADSAGASTAIKFKGHYEDFRYVQISSYMNNYSQLDRLAFEMYDNASEGGLHEYMTIKYGGKVGIGTDNPNAQLNIAHASNSTLTGVNYTGLVLNRTDATSDAYGSGIAMLAYQNKGGIITGGGTGMTFKTYDGTSATTRVTIKNDGNILINTTTDSGYKLDVNGTVRFANEVTASSFIKQGGTSSQFLKADGSVDSHSYLTSYSELWNANNDNIYYNNGNVTVGSTDFESKLNVEGDIKAYDNIISNELGVFSKGVFLGYKDVEASAEYEGVMMYEQGYCNGSALYSRVKVCMRGTNDTFVWKVIAQNLMGSCSTAGSGGGCFLAGTKITMDNNTFKNIEDVKIDDKLLTYDEINKKIITSKVKKIFIHTKNNTKEWEEGYYIIKTQNNNKIDVTGNHPIYTIINNKETYVRADKLKINGLIRIYKNNIALIDKIISIQFIKENIDVVYNLEVSNTHNYFANNILVHNKCDEVYTFDSPTYGNE